VALEFGSCESFLSLFQRRDRVSGTVLKSCQSCCRDQLACLKSMGLLTMTILGGHWRVFGWLIEAKEGLRERFNCQ